MKHLKEEFDKLTFKETLVYSLALLSITAGFVMIFLNIYIPPVGEIHESVLTAFGIILIFVGLQRVISVHFANDMTMFKRHVIDAINTNSEVKQS